MPTEHHIAIAQAIVEDLDVEYRCPEGCGGNEGWTRTCDPETGAHTDELRCNDCYSIFKEDLWLTGNVIGDRSVLAEEIATALDRLAAPSGSGSGKANPPWDSAELIREIERLRGKVAEARRDERERVRNAIADWLHRQGNDSHPNGYGDWCGGEIDPIKLLTDLARIVRTNPHVVGVSEGE